MKGWSSLGVVETIYEEEDDDDIEDLISPSPSSPSLSSPSVSTPLQSRVEAWTLANGREPNVLIRVQGTNFRLHKEPLTSRSIYLKRHLTASSDLTLSPPLNITADTFCFVTDFCYGSNITITPMNVVALRTAAELLEMMDGNGDGADDLRLVAEVQFRRFLTISKEHVSMMFRACLGLLPEAETAAFCVSRCTEALCEMMKNDDESDGDGFATCLDEVVKVGIENFQVMAESMHDRLSSHDVLYRMVDVYLQEHGGKLTEEDKSQISISVDCTKLSPDLLVHAVQNPRMPLRFAIRGMLVEQLRTRRTVLLAAERTRHPTKPLLPPTPKVISAPADETTLGGILHRDAALRQAVQLRAAMAATRSRIQTLEAELSGMKRLLDESRSEAAAAESRVGRSVIDSGRSASFHYGSSESNKIERCERRSGSSASCRFTSDYGGKTTSLADHHGGTAAGSCYSSETTASDSPRVRKSMRQRLISGLKLAFGVSNSSTKPVSNGKVSNREDAAKMK